jgi:DNA repair exonuclease SbcCD ATPase subunit
MKILNAIIENYKAIKRVEITPRGTITVISGNNSQGKSSAIEALVTTLAGKEKGKDVPVRKGSDGAIIEIDLGDRIIKRVIKGDRDELEVYTKEGHVVKRPRSVLDELMDKRKFDVMKFITGTPKEQRALLMELAGLSFDEIDAKRNVTFNERTMIGRERDSLKGQLDGLAHYDDAPKESVNTQAIITKIKENNEHNAGIQSNRLNIQAYKDKKSMLAMEIAQLEQRLKSLNEQLASAETALAEMEKNMETYAPADNTELELQLKNAEDLNNKFRQNEKRAEVFTRYQAKEKEYSAKTEELTAIEQKKIDDLKEAKFPIEGLSLTDEGVIYNNLPLENESRSNKLKVALAIAMSIPTELRTIILDDAEVLDDDNMKIVDEMMQKNDYQAIIARRQDPDDNTYIIKEGEIIK